MRLSRTHLVPVLAIAAGGVIGASLSFSFLALAPSGDVPVDPFGAPYEYVRYEEDQGVRSEDMPGVTLGLLYESSAAPEMGIRAEDPNSPVGERLYFSRRTEDGGRDYYVIDSDGENFRRLAYYNANTFKALQQPQWVSAGEVEQEPIR